MVVEDLEVYNGFLSLQKAFLHSSGIACIVWVGLRFSSNRTSRALDVQKGGPALYNRTFFV